MEFRKALRALNLGLSILEINEIIELVDSKDVSGHTRYDLVQGDGKINHEEFRGKLMSMPPTEVRLAQRANNLLSIFKDMMLLHMTSPDDAFRMFSKSKKGFLTFPEFKSLIEALSRFNSEKLPIPTFTVMKDLFDAIDLGHDGLLDTREWKTTF